MYRSPVVAVCALLLLGGFLSVDSVGQAGGGGDDLRKRMAAVESAIRDVQLTLKAQDNQIRELEERVVALEAWTEIFPGSMSSLRNAVDASEKAGFAYPAPNSRSKELLLEALRRLGADLSTPVKGKPSGK